MRRIFTLTVASLLALATNVRAAEHEWVAIVATAAVGGVWGSGTGKNQHHSCLKAMDSCQQKLGGTDLGCGALQRQTSDGWVVLLDCGTTRVVGSSTRLTWAEQDAKSVLFEEAWAAGRREL